MPRSSVGELHRTPPSRRFYRQYVRGSWRSSAPQVPLRRGAGHEVEKGYAEKGSMALDGECGMG